MTPSEAATIQAARVAIAAVRKARDEVYMAKSPTARREAWKRHRVACDATNGLPTWALRAANAKEEARMFARKYELTYPRQASRLIRWVLERHAEGP